MNIEGLGWPALIHNQQAWNKKKHEVRKVFPGLLVALYGRKNFSGLKLNHNQQAPNGDTKLFGA